MKIAPHHISFARLADLVEGRLTSGDAAEAQAHISGCRRCSQQATELGRVTQLMRTDTSKDAPRDVLLNAVEMFRARPVAEEKPGFLRRLVATLSFDSSSLTPAFGVRSGQAAPARQLLFSTGKMDVDLRLAPGGEGWTVSGQVLGPCPAGGRVEIEGSREAVGAAESAELNNLCEFILPPVPAGSYTLRLRLDDLEVEIPELDLRA
ncbi:MAG TPA: hypothetical protein VM934_17160 [Pyrinomonadaceae bacterium]|jgi:anti-sigma factor RsiW|nr:hypothetical protein [Pyrinomonadaceae bacterium]